MKDLFSSERSEARAFSTDPSPTPDTLESCDLVLPTTAKGKSVISRRHAKRLQQMEAAIGPDGVVDLEKLSKIPPIFLTVDLTWKCNYNCLGCIDQEAAGREQRLSLSRDLLEDLLSYSKCRSVEGMMVMGGEVLLYDHFDWFCFEAAQQEMPLYLVSNGSLIDRHYDALAAISNVPGTKIRVSINQYGEKYKEYTRADFPYRSIIASIDSMSNLGIEGIVSTVVFGEAAADALQTSPNVSDLQALANDLGTAGVKRHILLPARDPHSKAEFPLSEVEHSVISALEPPGGMTIDMSRFHEDRAEKVGNSPLLCPSSLLRVLVGADGSLYSCTDWRGYKEATIGKISTERPFETVWEREERVQRQMEYSWRHLCEEHACKRWEINRLLEDLLCGKHSVDDFKLSFKNEPFF